MSDSTFTFRVEERLKQEFTSAARSRDRTGAQILRDFMREYVTQQNDEAEYDKWYRRQVLAGLESANAGRLISNTEVESKFAAKRAATRRRLGMPEK